MKQPSARTAWINRHVWLAGVDLETEWRQAHEEGRDLRSVERAFKALAAAKPDAAKGGPLSGARDEKWLARYLALADSLQTLPRRRDYAYLEPSDLDGIRRARPRKAPALKAWRGKRPEFLRRLHGGLLGRMCGCMLGKPVEGWWREDIRITAEGTRNWPLANYLSVPTAAQARAIARRKPRRFIKANPWFESCLRPGIRCMVEDDDTNYTVTGFGIVKQWGAAFAPADVATFWMQNIPILHTCTAERVAYRNLVAGVLPPESATLRNPYREWIGAQIRADYFGYANPGAPARAAEWAWRDACISHVRNGIYGEMWVAAMLAAACVCDDWPTIVRAGLAQVPARCRLRDDVEKVLELRADGVTYEEAVNNVHRQWDEKQAHDWCHTNSNAQLVALALLYGEDDFGLTITRAVMPGFDTDCNGATAGSLWGMKHGVDALPALWTRPLRDRVKTGVDGYHETSISALAGEMVDVALRNAGG